MAAAFQSDAFQGDTFEASTYTLTADSEALVLAGQSATLSWSGSPVLTVDPEALTLTGQSANLSLGYTLTASPEALTLTGQSAFVHSGYYITSSSNSLTVTGQSSTLSFGRKLIVSPGEIALFPQLTDLDAQIDHVFTCGVIIDLLLPELSGNYRNYVSTLLVDSNPIPIRSFQLEETDQSLSASLSIELARLSDRSAITRTSDIDFSITTNGTVETLFSNGYLRRKDYTVSRQGIGPDDRVTFTALPQLAARLNTVPETTTVLYDSSRHTISADDFEGVYDKEHNYTPPVVTPIGGLDLYELFDRILVTACGFTFYVTNIPNFPVAVIEFAAGQSYINAIGGKIGMFEPEFIPVGSGIAIYDGTAGTPGGSPTPRNVTVSQARQLGVASDISIVDALLIHVSSERFVYDSSSTRTVIEQETEGTAGNFPTEKYTTTVTTTYRDYFRDNHPTRPIKTEIVREQRSTVYSPGAFTVHESDERFFFDSMGRMRKRTKTIESRVPTPVTFALGMNEVLYEEETVVYKTHPYVPRQFYIRSREVTQEGLVFIDGENQQLGEDYARSIMDAYRAGNVVDTMTSDWRKISTFKEIITPLRNNSLRIRRTEIDWLANQKHEDRNEIRQGEIGVNIFVNEQQKIYILSPGETTINGTIESVNMGELPLDTAIALGERILANRNTLPNRVSFDLAYIDNSLQKGTAITAIGRNGENLGQYIIEARTLRGAQGEPYTMTIQARQAD